jgi:sugar phosphate isomerase/epimerase
MQGRWGGETGVDREAARGYLVEALESLARVAAGHGVSLIYEPLNRYETNMANTIADGVALVESLEATNVVLLADLFHMNIEESNIAGALRAGGRHIGHVHFVDSNRRPPGCGHIDYAPIVDSLRQIGYAGFGSAEALPYPTPDEAAQRTIAAFRALFT